MHEMLKNFLETKKLEEDEKYTKEKTDLLIELGLYEKVYAPDNVQSDEYPYYEWDSFEMNSKFFKKVIIDVTNEEYELLKKYNVNVGSSSIVSKSSNSIANIFKVIGFVIYVLGFIAGLALSSVETGIYYTRTEFSFAIAFTYWCIAFVSGTIFFGFGEIISLLEAIKNK